MFVLLPREAASLFVPFRSVVPVILLLSGVALPLPCVLGLFLLILFVRFHIRPFCSALDLLPRACFQFCLAIVYFVLFDLSALQTWFSVLALDAMESWVHVVDHPGTESCYWGVPACRRSWPPQDMSGICLMIHPHVHPPLVPPSMVVCGLLPFCVWSLWVVGILSAGPYPTAGIRPVCLSLVGGFPPPAFGCGIAPRGPIHSSAGPDVLVLRDFSSSYPFYTL